MENCHPALKVDENLRVESMWLHMTIENNALNINRFNYYLTIGCSRISSEIKISILDIEALKIGQTQINR